MSLHPLRFTIEELGRGLPHPVATAFRLYVIANGLLFHVTGKTAAFSRDRRESFQTRHGMTIALKRAGFEQIVFSRPEGRLLVEAKAGPTTSGT